MYHLNGCRDNLNTLILLSKPYNNEIFHRNELKLGYHRFLNYLQPKVPRSFSIGLHFEKDPLIIKKLIELFSVDSALNDIECKLLDTMLSNNNREFFERKSDFVFKAYENFIKRYSEIADLFQLVINTVFYSPSKVASGGSTSCAIGTIWADLRETWVDSDCDEFFIHELTHNLLFLDEYCYQHYRDLTATIQKENYCLSAILSKARPVDKVLHSLLVAVEILLFREKHDLNPPHPKAHPPTKVILKKCLATFDSLDRDKNVFNLLTNRALELVNKCRKEVYRLSSEYKYQTISSETFGTFL